GWLERTGLAPLIDAVVGGDEVTAGKPAPAPYRLGVERLACRGETALAIEDSRQGATAARAAGLETLAIAAPDDRENWPPGVRFIARLADAGEILRRCDR
ncbi:HAD family hydrolase, partial [Zavarzinia sp.]|uniref:HAD family hydrolase n=1 Tax=Zavarzinia sp. TaxID=2027920 RepID=UPI003BB7F480